MSIKLMSLVWSTPLKGATKMLLLALADSANDEGVTWPSLNTLSKKCSISVKQICTSLNYLIEANLLSKEFRDRPNGSSSSNCYFLDVYNISILSRGGTELSSEGVLNSVQRGTELSSDHIIINRTISKSKDLEIMCSSEFLLNKFEEFWKLYPNKKAKPYCKKWFLKNCSKNKDLPEKIIEGVKRYLPYWATREDYVPHPHTWLNKGRWEDEIKESEIHIF